MNKKGFTLIEILVVIIIVATLAAFAITNYRRSIRDSNFDEAKVVLEQIAGAYMRMSAEMPATRFGSGLMSGTVPSDCNYKLVNGNAPSPMNLISCGYLDNKKWDQYDYTFYIMGEYVNDPPDECNRTFDDENPIACMVAKSASAGNGGKKYDAGDLAAVFYQRQGLYTQPASVAD